MAITTRAIANIDRFIPEIWAKEVGLESTSRRILAGLVDRIPFSGAGDQINLNQLPDIAATSVAFNAAIGTLTPTTLPAPTQRTLTPKMVYAFVQIERNLMNQWLPATEKAFQKRLGISIANVTETDISALHTSIGVANSFGAAGSPFDLATLLSSMGSIWSSGGDLVTQGVDRTYAIYHAQVWDNMMNAGMQSTAPFLAASTRGEANGPARTGRLQTVFGFDVDFTGHITLDTGAPRNLLFAEGAIVLGMKEEPEILIQPFELTTKVIAVQDYGVTLLWPVLAARHYCSL